MDLFKKIFFSLKKEKIPEKFKTILQTVYIFYKLKMRMINSHIDLDEIHIELNKINLYDKTFFY